MKFITLDMIKNMPDGTVFCESDKWGNLKNDIRILAGRFENKSGFNGEIGLYPFIEDREKDGIFSIVNKNAVLIKDKNFATGWYTTDTSDIDYEKDQLFAVFSKREVQKMIEVLQWALSDFESYFDMDEVVREEKAMIEVVYISDSIEQTEDFLENILTDLEKNGIRYKFDYRNWMFKTDKFMVYGLPISSGCLGLSHSNVKYYINDLNIENGERGKWKKERMEYLLTTFPMEVKEIRYSELVDILVKENEDCEG